MLPYGVFLQENKTRMRLKNAIVISTGRKASLSAQSCNPYLSSLGIKPRTLSPGLCDWLSNVSAPSIFFKQDLALNSGFKPRVQGGGLRLHLENCSFVDIHICEDFFYYSERLSYNSDWFQSC